MKVNTLRGQSISSSTNSFRAILLVYSDIFSTIYAEHIQTLTNNPTWANQIEISESEKPTLFYVIPKIGETNNANKTTTIGTISKSHSMNNNNIYSPKSLEPSTILYSINQPTDLQLWDSSFCPISIFEINEYLEDNAKNITCSLYKIATFIM